MTIYRKPAVVEPLRYSYQSFTCLGMECELEYLVDEDLWLGRITTKRDSNLCPSRDITKLLVLVNTFTYHQYYSNLGMLILEFKFNNRCICKNDFVYNDAKSILLAEHFVISIAEQLNYLIFPRFDGMFRLVLQVISNVFHALLISIRNR